MTVLEWLKDSTDFTFSDNTFIKIAYDRGCDPDADAYCGCITQKQKDLMLADLIVKTVLFRPSRMSSFEVSHNGFKKSIGSEYDTYRKDKIMFALGIYKKYDDAMAETLENAVSHKITFIPIEDI